MFLLDTCTLLWLTTDLKSLGKNARRIIEDGSNKLFVSPITAFEIGIKSQKRKLILPMKLEEWYPKTLLHYGLLECPLNGEIMISATHLPQHHTDPADRILIATALKEGMILLSPDPLIQKYSAQVVWE